jgi:hypothetical protein
MSEQDDAKVKASGDELPVPWQSIQTAIWLIGLAIIASQDWWWPGILVLVAFSGLAQAAVKMYLDRQKRAADQLITEKELEKERGGWLPSLCPNCGGPISVATVHWTGSNTADCPYCKANLKKPA